MATEVRSRLGNTTHISVMDAEGSCASVTCSNGSCSGVVVPGTGVHLNNMLGEQDLNPLGFHRHPPGARVPSMMAPTVVLRDGRPRSRSAAPGRTGSARRSSRPSSHVVDDGLAAQEAVSAPRLHVEDGQVDAEPGVDAAALDRLEQAGWRCRRWSERNLFFGGVQAVARNPDTGRLTGGGDPRRGGVATVVSLSPRPARRSAASAGRLAQVDPAEAEGLVPPRGPEVVHGGVEPATDPGRGVGREQLPQDAGHAGGVRRRHRRA